jgi:hypothetical protein
VTAPARWILALLASLALHTVLAGALHWTASRPDAHIGPLGPAPPAGPGAGR